MMDMKTRRDQAMLELNHLSRQHKISRTGTPEEEQGVGAWKMNLIAGVD